MYQVQFYMLNLWIAYCIRVLVILLTTQRLELKLMEFKVWIYDLVVLKTDTSLPIYQTLHFTFYTIQFAFPKLRLDFWLFWWSLALPYYIVDILHAALTVGKR